MRSLERFLLAGLLLSGCDGGEDKVCEDPSPGTICPFIGDGVAAFDGDHNPLLSSSLYWPIDLTFTEDGRGYVADWNNHRIRRITDEGTLETIIGTDFVGDGPPGATDQTLPGADGLTIDLNHPTQFMPLPNGKFLLVSWHNHKLREWDPATGLVYVSCGGPAGFRGDGGPAKMALLDQPQTVSLAPSGELYILDQRNQVIRMIDPSGIISTVAGTPKMAGFAGDGESPMNARMSQPSGSNPPPGGGMVLDAQGRLYFSDVLNHRVRRIDFAADRIETIAGNGTAGFGGDDGPATSAMLNNPRKLAFGPDGRLYVADEFNHRIRAVNLEDGTITTVVGNGTATYAGDGGPATEASINQPAGVTFFSGWMYVLDTYNHRIRRVKL